MRKLLKPLASLIAATTLAGTAWADNWGYHATDRSWIVIKVGDVSTAYSLDGSGLPAFQYADLGVITQGDPLTIVKYDTKTWKNGGNVTGCAYSYAIDGGTAVDMGGNWVKDLGWDGSSQNQLWGRNSADADQYSSSTDVNAVIDTSTLPLGRHTLTIYGEITGGDDPAGPISDGPYVAGFMVADSSGGGSVTENTVTYTVDTKTSVTTSGTAPDGSSATFAQTANNLYQITANNSMTLTLSGYKGVTITGLKMSMKSNASKGAGSLSVTSGDATIASIPNSNFNTANWYGDWSGSAYVTVTPTVTATLVDANDVVIKIEGSVNSLYCESFTITYTQGSSGPGTFAITLDPDEAITVGVGEEATITATPKDAAAGPISYAWTINGNPAGGSGYLLAADTTAVGTYTVTCTASDSESHTTDPVSVSYTVVTKYAVTIDDSIENGTVTVDKATAAENEQVTVTATADPGYELEAITVNGSEITGNTFSMPAGDAEVSATFIVSTDYVVLPFEYAGPWQTADLKGLSQEGLGSDYTTGGSKGAKFDTTGDWLQVKFNEAPGTLSYELTGNSIGGAYVFRVEESADGVSWDTVVSYDTVGGTELSTTRTAYENQLSANARFVRFYYVNKASGNVRLDNLSIAASAPVTKYAVTIDDSIVGGTVTADKAEAAAGATVNVTASPDRGYALATLKYNGTDIVNGSFEMPAADVEVTATFTAVPVYKRIESADDFVTGAKYLVVAYKDGNSSYTSALKNVATDNDQISVDETISIEFADDGKFISVDNAAIVWKILHTSSVAGDYVLFNETANVYAAALNNANKAQLLSADDGNLAQWTFDFADVPAVKMYSLAYPSRWLQRNGTINNKFFATYDTTGTEPWLFIDTSTDAQTVYFDWNDGSGTVTSMKYVKGDQYPWFERLEKPDAYLVGWYDAPTDGNRVRLGTVTDDDTRTVYARWESQQTVKFVANGGSDTTPQTYSIGGTYTSLPTPSFDGHDFQGWFTADGVEVEVGDAVVYAKSLTLYAHWSGQETKTVTFNPNGGTCATASLQCGVGTTYPTFPTPSRFGYVFLGWFDGDTRVKGGEEVADSSPLTLTAHWTNTQTVTFVANGGTCQPASLEAPLGGVYPALPTPVWEGQTFLGWFTVSGGDIRVEAGDPVTSSTSRTLYAKWQGATLQIVEFNPNGGTCSKVSIACEIGSTYPTFPTPRLAGSTFKGWYTAEDKRVKGGMEVSDENSLELFAKWKSAATMAITGFSVSSRAASPSARGTRAATVECTLWVETVADVVYEIQWTPSLDDEWTVLKRWTADADAEIAVPVSVPAGETAGFFRLVEIAD